MSTNLSQNRDNFSLPVTETLAKRAAFRCSNPVCRKSTIGPCLTDANKSVSVAVAAHITAAAPNGPRYDQSLTSPQRSSIENGIHLCSNCATRIDKNGGNDYPVPLLKQWKSDHEQWVYEQQFSDSGIHPNFNFVHDFQTLRLHTRYSLDALTDIASIQRSNGNIIVHRKCCDALLETSKKGSLIGRR